MNMPSLHSFLHRLVSRQLPALATVMLAACGGGGGGGGGPEPTVATANINPIAGNVQDLMVTLSGTNLAAGLSVTSPQCTTLTRTTKAPNASDASTAYYRCASTAAAPTTVTVTAARSSDGSALKTATFTVGAAPAVTQALAGEGAVAETLTQPGVAGNAKYSQLMTVTLTGTNVNQGLSVLSGGCTSMTLSTSPPFISSASTAYYRCKVTTSSGLDQVLVSPANDNTVLLANPRFFTDTPQVTLSLKMGEGTAAIPLGNVVLTLAAAETPQTVDNFLAYVNSGFYNGTIFDYIAKTPAPGPTPTLVLGGSYTPTNGIGRPQPKPAGAAIALEVGRGLSNVQWSVGMDHPASGPNTATSGFYINLVNNPQMDPALGSPGFAVFGTVDADPASGRSVLTRVAKSSCEAPIGFNECLPIPNVIIDSAVQTR